MNRLPFLVVFFAFAALFPALPASAQTITGFAPVSGPVGTSVTITGTGLTGTTVVGFQNQHVASFTVNGAGTQITTAVPAGAATGPIAVLTNGVEVKSRTNFTVTVAAPTVTSFSPASGKVGASVTITGTNFTGATSVKFNGTAATTYSVVSVTSITATVPTGATTGTISVTTPGGTAASTAQFTVTVPAPTITSFTPASGPAGTAVTITGTNLTGATVVGFQGQHAASFTVVSATQITTSVPAGAVTGPIAVLTPGGQAKSSANFTVTTVPAALANLSVSPSSVIGGASVTATVTLSAPAPSGGSVIALLSGNSSATLPNTLTIASGSSSGTFTITTSSVSATAPIAISGAYQEITQAATLYVQPAGTSLAIQNLGATAGNTCAVLSWMELPEGSVTGYNVYRLSGGKPVKLTATPQAFPMYADTGLTNGTAYQYEVSSVDTQGHESALSSAASATPLASVATLSWVSPPTSASENVSLYATSSGGTVTGITVLVDGEDDGSVGLSDPNSSPTGAIQADIDISGLSNGSHSFQLVGYTDSGEAATVPVSISCSSFASSFYVDDIVDQDNSEVAQVNAVLPSNTISWAVQITDDNDNSTAYTINGTSPNVHFAWNGENSSGVQLPADNYTLTLTAATPAPQTGKKSKIFSSSSTTRIKPVALIRGTPNALALLNEISVNPGDDVTLGKYIGSQLAVIKSSNPGFTYNVFLKNKNAATVHFRKLLRSWLQNTVTDLYIFGHGEGASDTPPVVQWGGANFWGGASFPSPEIPNDAVKHPELHFIIPNIVGSRQYNFVWIDACQSAGGTGATPPNDISTPDFSWASAFNIGTNQNFSSCFFGWDGFAGLNTYNGGGVSNWFTWREDFWRDIAAGAMVSQAVNYANTTYPGSVAAANPTDSNGPYTREQQEEDTMLP